MAIGRRKKKFRGARKCQFGLWGDQHRLFAVFFCGELARDYGPGARFQREAQMLFVLDKHQVCRRRLRDARDSTDLDATVSHELRLDRFGNRPERALHGIFVYVWRRKEKC